jgi:serine O-acetyltransferase
MVIQSTETTFNHPLSVFAKVKNRVRRWPEWIAWRDNELMRSSGLRRLLMQDLKRHMYDWTLPGFRALAVYRFGTWAHATRFLPLRILLVWFHVILFRLVRNRYGIELYASCIIGRRFLIGHQSGIVIHRFARFGDDCLIRQNVTLGEAGMGRDNFGDGLGPVIGNNVDIGAGAVVMGNVRIGDNVRIGPNSVIMTDIPANATVIAPPSRTMVRPCPEALSSPNTSTEDRRVEC